MSKSESSRDKIASAYKQLATSAVELNAVSDELGKWISALDAALKKLNLGISTWITIDGGENPENGDYWRRRLGYEKVAGKWGIAISDSFGNEHTEYESSEEWLFNDAPRRLRIEAVEKLPELLDALVREADKAAEQIKIKVAYAQDLAAAVDDLARPTRQSK